MHLLILVTKVRATNLKNQTFVKTITDLRVKLQTGSSEATPKLRLQQYLSSLPTSTAVVSAVQTLIRVLLLYTAKSRGCSHLLLGTSLTSLSISLISSISQGAGFAVHEEVQEEWQPPDSLSSVIKDGFALYTGPIRLLRPLQDLTVKECATWAWWSDLRIVGRDKWPIAKQGIGSLTKCRFHRNFVCIVMRLKVMACSFHHWP